VVVVVVVVVVVCLCLLSGGGRGRRLVYPVDICVVSIGNCSLRRRGSFAQLAELHAKGTIRGDVIQAVTPFGERGIRERMAQLHASVRPIT